MDGEESLETMFVYSAEKKRDNSERERERRGRESEWERKRERGLHCKCLPQKLWTVQLLTNVKMAVVSFDIESDTTAAIKAG